MKRRLFWLVIKVLVAFAILAIGVWLGEKIQTDPGYVLLVYGGWSLESSIWVFLLLLSLAMVLAYGSVRLASKWRVHQHLGRWREGVRNRQSIQRTKDGLSALARGQFAKAFRLFVRSAENAHLPALSYLLAALAAHADGREEDCDRCLAEAECAPGVDPVLAGLLQGHVQIQRGSFEQALATLTRIEGQNNNPLRLHLLRKVYHQLQDWNALDDTLKSLNKASRRTPVQMIPDQSFDHQVTLALQRLSQNQDDLSALKSQWKQMSGSIRKEASVIAQYAEQLAKLDAKKEAERILHKAIDSEFRLPLVELYGQIDCDAKHQLVVAEQWLKQRPNDSDLLLALGRLALRNQLWGKAEEYLEFSARLKSQPVIHAELARYYAAKQDWDMSHAHFEKGVQQLHPLPDLPLPQPEESDLSHG